MTVTDEGLGRVGWSTKAATLDLGTDPFGFGFGGTGKKSNAKQFSDYGVPYKKDDSVGCYLDADEGTIAFSVNGKVFETAFHVPAKIRGFALYPAVVLKNAEIRVNFGGQEFAYPPNEPFLPLSQADPSHIISSNADVYDSKAPRRPIALIMEPSRELAEQTYEAIGTFHKYLTSPSLTRGLFVGGESVKPQVSLLKSGVDIAIGTPGRLMELIQSGEMDISGVRFFVLDEADRLLDTGNSEAIQTIYKRLKKTERLQVLLFSATLHSADVCKLAESICQFPMWVDLKGRDTVPETVDLAMIWADTNQWKDLWTDPFIPTDGVHRRDNVSSRNLGTPEAKSEAIKRVKFALVPKIIDAFDMDQALIFCRTRVDCDNLESYLLSLSGGKKSVTQRYSCCTLHSGKVGGQRRDNYQAFKDGEVKYLICTDLAARGLDVQGLPYVINVTLPDNPADFIHRIGRVGRADRMGLAISIVAPEKEKVWYHTCKTKGQGCFNTNLIDKGGCCIWYDERSLLTEIQTVSEEMHLLKDDLTLPEMLEAVVKYGVKRGDKGVGAVLTGHEEYVRGALSELSKLETDAQINFYSYQRKFK